MDRMFSGPLRDHDALKARSEDMVAAAAERVHAGRAEPRRRRDGFYVPQAHLDEFAPVEAAGPATSRPRVSTLRHSTLRSPPNEATVTPHRHPDAVVEGIRRALSPFRATGLEGARESIPHGGGGVPVHARRARDSTSHKAHYPSAHSVIDNATAEPEPQPESDSNRTALSVLRALIGNGADGRPFAGAHGGAGKRDNGGQNDTQKAKAKEGEGEGEKERVWPPQRPSRSKENGGARAASKSKLISLGETPVPRRGDAHADAEPDSGTRAGGESDLAMGVGSKRKRPRADGEGGGGSVPAAKRSRKGETRSADGVHAKGDLDFLLLFCEWLLTTLLYSP
ncbi:hypothetical protein K438DRAFT_244762 [Mycena galopus ATCC 62051]|nr:hypothetical protein K438DRAFT_244762 [Mycena galopus ATCC 62051]